MDDNVPLLIGVLVILVLFSAFFSSTETAFSAANRLKLKNLNYKGNKRAGRTIKLIDNFDQLLSSILIGNNLVNILATSIATMLFVEYFGSTGVTIATVVMTIVVLTFGEISPKTLAKEIPERFAMATAPFINFFVVLFKPLNFFFAIWKKLLAKIFKISSTESISEEELLTYVEEAKDVGGINENEESLIKQALEFDEVTTADIITPRVDLAAISIDETNENIDKVYYDSGFSRLPVYEESIDNIVGVLLLKDYFYSKNMTHKKLKDLIRPTVFVTKTIKVSDLLTLLQKNHSYLAVVVDEFGGTLGIVTIEDIIEELIGDIWDEHDIIVKDIEKMELNKYKVMGGTDVEDMFEEIGIQIPEDITSTTVNGWVLESMDRLPDKGEELDFGTYSVSIGKVDKNRIEYVILTVKGIPGNHQNNI